MILIVKKMENMKEKRCSFFIHTGALVTFLNVISLLLCALLIFVRFVDFARYNFIWPSNLQDIQANTIKIVLVITLLKLFLIIDKDKEKVLVLSFCL